jgi:Immunity protein 50
MAKISIDELEGGSALCAWFGGVPSFHDATLRELELHQGAPGKLVAHTFRMESETDADGYFILTKHVAVALIFFNLVEVQLFEFMEAGIIGDIDIERDEDGTTFAFDSEYSVHGRVKAKRVVVAFEPRQPEPKRRPSKG